MVDILPGWFYSPQAQLEPNMVDIYNLGDSQHYMFFIW
jgi:hypothetical protein